MKGAVQLDPSQHVLLVQTRPAAQPAIESHTHPSVPTRQKLGPPVLELDPLLPELDAAPLAPPEPDPDPASLALPPVPLVPGPVLLVPGPVLLVPGPVPLVPGPVPLAPTPAPPVLDPAPAPELTAVERPPAPAPPDAVLPLPVT
jgi:signal-induced proliferation-associated 1 like protein 3